MKFNDFIQSFITVVKTNIIELAQTELSNENKKMVLDNKIINYIDCSFDKLRVNFIIKKIIKTFVISNVSIITQLIYDLIKTKIDGITN